MSLVDNLRSARSAPASIFAQVQRFIAKDINSPVFIVEGKEDVGVYTDWISRSKPGFQPVVFDVGGKDSVLGFYEKWREVYRNKAPNIYFLIDRDYDGTKGVSTCERVYVTNAYSVENIVFCRELILSFLDDEIGCVRDHATKSSIIGQFNKDLDLYYSLIFFSCMKLFLSRIGGFKVTINDDYVSSIKVGYGSVFVRKSKRADWNSMVVSSVSCGDFKEELLLDFQRLDQGKEYRGKFIQYFYIRWLCSLFFERRNGNKSIFPDGKAKVVGDPNQYSLRAFASRVQVPRCFSIFVASIS